MDVWLEREALCLPLRKKENALVVHAWGADVAAMVAALKATRDEAASDALSTTWVVPKGRGVLVEHDHGELVATFPSVRAASRCFDDPDVALRLRPYRPQLERAAPRADTPELETALSFRRVERGGLVRRAAKVTVGQDPVLHQWTYREGALRSHALLRDGGSKLTVYVAATSLPAPLSSVDAARDPALTRPREDFDALLFARGLPSFDAAFDFDREHGGIAFWADGQRVQLGAASLLLTDPGLTAEDLAGPGGRVPVAFAYDRLWAMGSDGTMTLVDDDGDPGPARSPAHFVDAHAFLTRLARDATPWRGFPYPVEA